MTAAHVSEAAAAAALHGSFCPKMCTFACPVTTATGREDAVPWSFHRTVSDMALGRLPVTAELGERLTACSGCLACQVPCVFDQDVPAQVRAGRAALVAAGAAPAAVTQVIAHVEAGQTPTGMPALTPPAGGDAPNVRLAIGCHDSSSDVDAAVKLLWAAGERVAVHVPTGCCGALLDDLGAVDLAGRAATALPVDLPVVATDPHCLPAWRSQGADVTDLASHLDALVTAGHLVFRDASETDGAHITWHDPCLLARQEGVVDPPRRLLTAAGMPPADPEHARAHTFCSGAGLGLGFLDAEAAAATASVRAAQLGPGSVVTGCARARDQLRAAGVAASDLASTLLPRVAPSDGSPP